MGVEIPAVLTLLREYTSDTEMVKGSTGWRESLGASDQCGPSSGKRRSAKNKHRVSVATAVCISRVSVTGAVYFQLFMIIVLRYFHSSVCKFCMISIVKSY